MKQRLRAIEKRIPRDPPSVYVLMGPCSKEHHEQLGKQYDYFIQILKPGERGVRDEHQA